MATQDHITIPINSFAKNRSSLIRVGSSPDVGLRWGGPSGFRFEAPQGEEAENGQGVDLLNLDDIIVDRTGTEVLWVHQVGADVGEDVAPNNMSEGTNAENGGCENEEGDPHEPTKMKDLPDYPGQGWVPASPWTFFIRTFVEETEETEQIGGVTKVTPVFTTVHLYVTWDNAQYIFIWPSPAGTPDEMGNVIVRDNTFVEQDRYGIEQLAANEVFQPDVVILEGSE